MAGILIAVALYSVSRQNLFMENCSQDLKNSLLQAQEVKCDLEEMMLNTINISRGLADQLESRTTPESASSKPLDTFYKPVPKNAYLEVKKPVVVVSDTPLRVHELAEQMGISSRELLNRCQALGLGINHHMKMLDADQVKILKGEKAGLPEIETLAPKSPGFVPELVSSPASALEGRMLNPNRAEKPQPFSLEEIKQAHPYLAVRTLWEQGYNQKEIARILGRGQSEISLILNLTKQKQACS